jgi:DNA modification methylase
MTKLLEQKNFGFDNRKKVGPVECLGMTFKNDDERRTCFAEKLKKKLKDPEFRKIEGFPIGEDEDILALSDPPYYTACPNPFLEDFIKHYGKPFNPSERYHQEPFVADVREGKNHPLYLAHSYHTKVPHKAIMRYILHYTKPGDIVFDGFCGSGMTGVAATLCGDTKQVEGLDYRVMPDGTILDRERKVFSKIGCRYSIQNDLSPVATFIAYNYNYPISPHLFETLTVELFQYVRGKCGWMYSTLHDSDENLKKYFIERLNNCKNNDDFKNLFLQKTDRIKNFKEKKISVRIGYINYTVFSDVFICTECGEELVFWEEAFDKKKKSVKKEFFCPECSALLTKRKLDHAKSVKYDPLLKTTVTQIKQIPVLINYTFNNKVFEKEPDILDLAIMEKVESLPLDCWIPFYRMPKGDEARRNDKFGLTHVHHFYSSRAIFSLGYSYEFARLLPEEGKRYLLYLIEQAVLGMAKISRYVPTHYSQVNQYLSGTLYIGSQVVDVSLEYVIGGKVKRLGKILNNSEKTSGNFISCQDAAGMLLGNNSIDYIFVDPPFGGNLMYSALNFLWEAWLRVLTDNEKEAVTNNDLNKGLSEYQFLMLECFKEFYRILKPGHWITVEFSNTKASIWNAIQATLQEAGFVVANVAVLDKKQGTFKAITTPTAVKQDLIISAYKPNGGLEKRFLKKADTEEGVWDFIKAHLKNLPSVKPKGGQLEFITERDPRILYDRTVAYYVKHGFPVPISSPEFQTALADKFPERDGMYFLPDQAAEYDKKRIKMEGLGQMVIWVEDERSAADWLRNFLKNKPSKYQEIQPEFFEKLNEAWKKWETRPELRALLDQYFLCYDGQGNVPPQIHSYLSTNFKELRKLPADDPLLRSKAKDRWYVPDPRKNADVEKLREKRLLEEFWTYLPPGYDLEAIKRRVQSGQETLPGMEAPPPKIPKGKRLKLVRTEAVRVGFKQCYQIRDYQTIIAVAHYIPEDVVNGDDQLQMIYDSAVTRSGLEV